MQGVQKEACSRVHTEVRGSSRIYGPSASSDAVGGSGASGRTRSLAELCSLVAVGLGHCLLEIVWSEEVALGFTASAVVAFSVYVALRLRRRPELLQSWGLHRENSRASLTAHLGFALVGSLGLILLGATLQQLQTPPTFWALLLVYPLWGGAQQFALQNFVGANVARFVKSEVAVAVATGLLFGLSHVPRWDLTLLTMTSGVAFTWIYRRYPNLWAVALAHGVLGTLAIHFVVGEDPLRALLGG